MCLLEHELDIACLQILDGDADQSHHVRYGEGVALVGAGEVGVALDIQIGDPHKP